jgi:hypothetical protein
MRGSGKCLGMRLLIKKVRNICLYFKKFILHEYLRADDCVG